MKTFLILLALLTPALGLAHDGPHGPTQKLAPHGGILRDGKVFMAEMVKDTSGVKLYVLKHDGTAIAIQDVTIDPKLSTVLDAKKKVLKADFKAAADHWEVTYENTGSHRYVLTLVAAVGGKTDKFSWQIEAQNE